MPDEPREAVSQLLALRELAEWRRDVRRFRRDAVPEALLDRLLRLADLAPSVGNSQPWRWVQVASPERRQSVREIFEAANAAAAQLYRDQQAEHYLGLKLAGFDNAPIHLAVFCDHGDSSAHQQGHGLGRQTMPESLEYSCACMIMLLWLAAREAGLGLGWVSIIDPAEVSRFLDVPANWKLVGYLLLGWPEEAHLDPELERAKWQTRTPFEDRNFKR